MNGMPNKTSSKDKAEQYRNERKERIAKAAKKRKKNLDKRLKLQKLIGKVIAITLGAAAVLGIAFYILWFTGIFETSPTALTLGEQKVSVRDYTYYYSLMYNYTVNQAKQYQQQYGQDMIGLDLTKSPEDQECPYKNDKDETQTWAEYFRTSAIDRAKQYELLYREAIAAKYALTDKENKEIADQIEQIRKTAAGSNLSLNAYLRMFYGKGITEKFLTAQLKKETLVSRYAQEKYKSYEKAVTDKYISDTYKKAKDNYDVVSLRLFSFNLEKLSKKTGETDEQLAARQKEADAKVKEKADAMLAAVKDEATFLTLAAKNTADKAYDAETATINYYKKYDSVKSSVSEAGAKWAFGDGRKAGDKSVFKTDSAYVVVYVVRAQFPANSVDVRHILISFKEDTQDTTEPTAKEIEAARKKAAELYAKWKKGAATEDSFSALAKTESADTGSNEKGGLYDDMRVGTMVAPFEKWSFDPARKKGDTGIVKTDYGYHIMYFVANNKDDFDYEETIRTAKAEDDYNAYETGLSDKAEYKLAKNEKNIDKGMKNALKAIDTKIASDNSSSSSVS